MAIMRQLLIVEDDEGDLEYIREWLSDPGALEKFGISFMIDTSERLSTALALLDKKTYDLILLDLSLPDSEGLDTLEGIAGKTGGAPVIILTGLNDMDISVKALEHGAAHYFVKGFIDRDELIKNIRAVSESYRRRRKLGL